MIYIILFDMLGAVLDSVSRRREERVIYLIQTLGVKQPVPVGAP